ncbi:hypothetical protein Daus18300_012408 [Diaporthe australafricana]|uniref:Mg2+ transporter n=1 Tax=Diaporthe australafricana TaxID=127596 RepID=A0ABR3W2Z2_9PEZI
MNKRQFGAEDWPRIWHSAQRVNANLAIDVDIGPDHKPPPRRLQPLLSGNRPSDAETSAQKTHTGEAQTKPGVEHTKKLSPEWRPEFSSRTDTILKPESISIFSFLEGVPQLASVDESVLNEHLLEVEEFLLNQTNFTDRKAYRGCKPSSRVAVHKLLQNRGSDLSQTSNSSTRDQQDYEEEVDIFNTADIIFRFFFPAHSEVATVGKFWGAIQLLVKHPKEGSTLSRRIRRQRGAINRTMRNLTITIASFNDIFGHSDCQQLEMVIPDGLKNAWLHLTMGLIFVPYDEDMSETLLLYAQLLMEEGIEEIVKSLSAKSLTENSLILPMELFSLMGLKLLQDSTAGLPDISHTYSAYLESVAADIANKPSDRLHERRLGLLKQEITVIQKSLDAQYRILDCIEKELKPQVTKHEWSPSMDNSNMGYENSRNRWESSRWDSNWRHEPAGRSRSLARTIDVPGRPPPVQYVRSRYQDNDYSNRTVNWDRDHRTNIGNYEDDAQVYYDATQPNPDFKLAPTDAGGFRKLFNEECFRHIERRRREFGEFRYQASILEEENQNKVETTKDRQERAIYAFTIVTIIFLPLSSVASIFGINTKDVRDTDLGQWVYWATAVPVTAAVVFFGLLWTGELGNILRWISSFGTQVRGGYQKIPDEYYDGDAMYERRSRAVGVVRVRDVTERERLRSRSPSPPPPPPSAFVRRREVVY